MSVPVTPVEIGLTTPALLFPAISLLLLAYTNRFMTLASLIRNLYAQWQDNQDHVLFGQLTMLRRRLILIRNMQAFGIASLLLCVVDMFVLYLDWRLTGTLVFGVALVLLIVSLGLSLYEIQISVQALDLQLSDLAGPRRMRNAPAYCRLREEQQRETEPPPVTGG